MCNNRTKNQESRIKKSREKGLEHGQVFKKGRFAVDEAEEDEEEEEEKMDCGE